MLLTDVLVLNIVLFVMKKISIKDIAKEVGVSVASVSIVLSNKNENKRVSKPIADKIKQKAKELNYQPNRLARSLRSGKSYTVGLLVADISNSFFAQLAKYVQLEVEKSGYASIVLNTDEDPERARKMVELLSSRQVDGVIMVPTVGSESLVCNLIERHIPLVLVDRFFPGLAIDSVTIENMKAAYQITTYLLMKDHRKRPVFVVYDKAVSNLIEREQGYRKAMIELGLQDYIKVIKISYDHTKEDIQKKLGALLEKPRFFDAFVFATDNLAIEGLSYLAQCKIDYGHEIGIACFDKCVAYDFLPVKIPYIAQPIQAMGEKAVKALLDRIDKGVAHKGEALILEADFVF